MKIRQARKSDLPAVEQLLAASKLPVDGVRDHFTDFVVAEDTDGIEGAVGLEKYDSVALLRSAVVAPGHRGSGVGKQLVEQVLERAEEAGISELYLLTTTAENYFPRFGFTRTTRAAVPEELKASAEFRGACPDTAIVMKRRLGGSAGEA
ncbi:MAG TPA: arsenic resistance N-acetyltransferase ArsN2 [Gemmatimonadaceae bacterium]|jgi:amino-acid N-acetyltransferase|nr:arsenic resistance N-acetyltransferase ArsN2 [Gemmatimonadaceae bacterium]